MARIAGFRKRVKSYILVIYSIRNIFLIMYSERETSKLWVKLIQQNPNFSTFVSTGHFGTFFPEIWPFFWLWTESSRASAKKFPTVFSEMHWRCGRQHSCFLLIFQFFFPGTWAVFVEVWAKKFRLLSQNS